MSNQRRDFLKKSILGMSAAAFIPASLKSASASTDLPVNNTLPTRVLGRTGIKIPVLSMGTGDTQNPAMVKAALDNGVKLLGTSAYYGNGNNETLVGKVVKDFPRESVLVATSTMPKGTDHQNGVFTDPSAGEAFTASFHESLKRLGTDYVDILFLPFVAKRESVFFEPLLRAMEDIKKSGKARFIGIATHSWIDEAITAAADAKIYDLVMAAYNFKLERMQPVQDAIAYAANAGLGIIAMKTMAGGYWDKERNQPINSQSALKWVLQNENVHTMMSGMTSYDELQSNLALMKDFRFTDSDKAELRLADARREKGLYCLQCHECAGQCPNHVDIPTLMRSYMYAYGYRNMHHAQQTLEMAKASACSDCESCTVTCRAGFRIQEKINDIARLATVPPDFYV